MNPTITYLFKDNKRNTRKRCKIRSKLTIKTQNDVIHVVQTPLFLTYVSIVDLE